MKNIFTSSVFIFILFIFSSTNAQWIKTGGPQGSTVLCTYNAGGILFTGTDAQGIYKSTDNGNIWIAANTGIENKSVHSLLYDGSYVYAGTLGSGVYRSADMGVTWQAANTGIATVFVNDMTMMDTVVVIATNSSGVWSSTDHGNSWVDISQGSFGFSNNFAIVYRAPRLMVESDNYIFYTDTIGTGWYVDQGVTAFSVIQHFWANGDTIFAAANNRVFVTYDGGFNWNPGIEVDPDYFMRVVGFGCIGNTVYAGSKKGVFASTDWGASWNLVSQSGLRDTKGECYNFIISAGKMLLSFEEIGIYSSLTGTSWMQVPLSDFEPASDINNTLFFDGSKLIAGTQYNGVYASTNQGNTWSKIGTTNPLDTLSSANIFAVLSVTPNILLAGSGWFGLFRSDDNGATWTHIFTGLPYQSGTGMLHISSLAKSGSKIVAGTGEGLYYSNNNGLTWNASNIIGDADATGFAVNGNVVCAYILSFTITSGMYRSVNNGVTWSLVSTGPIDIVSMDAGGSNHMYAGGIATDNWMSADNGVTWNPVGTGIPSGSGGFSVLAWENYVFFGNALGIFYSEDFGASFEDSSMGFDPYPNNAVQGLERDSTYIYAGFFRNAVWRRPLSDFGFISAVNVCNYTLVINPTAPILCPNTLDTLITTQLFDTYQWYKDGNLIPGATNQSYQVSSMNDAGSNFTVEVSLDTCPAIISSPVLVDGWAFLPVTVQSSGDLGWFDGIGSNLCEGDTMILTMLSPNQFNMQWYENGNVIGGATDTTYLVTQSGSYTVSGAPDICPDFTQFLGVTINVVVHPAVIPFITQSSDTLFCMNANSNFQWYHDGSMIAGATNNWCGTISAGSYTVTASDSNSCIGTSTPFIINGIDALNNSENFIYPNPANNEIIIGGNLLTGSLLTVTDRIGRRMLSEKIKITQTNYPLAIAQLPSGVYFISLKKDEIEWKKIFLKE